MNAQHLFAIAGLALALTASPAAAGWQEHSYTIDKFAVDFSGDITVRPTNLDADTTARIDHSTTYIQDGGSFAYVVGATLTKGSFDFKSGSDGAMSVYKCATTGSDTFQPTADGEERLVHASTCESGLKAAGRFIMKDKWFYQVMYLIPGTMDSADAEHFLASFRLLPD